MAWAGRDLKDHPVPACAMDPGRIAAAALGDVLPKVIYSLTGASNKTERAPHEVRNVNLT